MDELGEALLILQAEAEGYHLSQEEVEESKQEALLLTKGIILDMPAEFFSERTPKQLLALRYSQEQIDTWIIPELTKLDLTLKPDTPPSSED